MSIELFVYSAAPKPNLADFDETMRRAGWTTRFVAALDDLRPRPIDEATLVIGVAAEVSLSWDAGVWSQADINALYRDEKIALAAIDVVVVGEEERVALADIAANEAPAELRQRIHDAMIIYVITTSATRNTSSIRFQVLVWGALGVATAGILHDPEDGKITDNPP